ncbi:MAG: ATP-binding protein [Cytophagaceae bacterium]|jgi:hypothetical protein|nr:ATP-binding protein [Cytophagaceae bacterium]
MNDPYLYSDLLLLKELIESRVYDEEREPLEWLDYSSSDIDSTYVQVLKKYQASESERIILLMAIAPHLMPEVFDIFTDADVKSMLEYSVVGGFKSNYSHVYLPTGRMAIFILKNDWETINLFNHEHYFKRANILSLNHINKDVPYIDSLLQLSEEFLNFLNTGHFVPAFGENFPARKTETHLSWEELVLRDETATQVEELKSWIRHQSTISDHPHLSRLLKKGYRALFYGPSGTGKTLTASLLGKSFDMPVYVVDLSAVVSKYIGETEKNLEKIFKMAESKGWILFFDEGEALFGKRTGASSSNDRYANQEVSYLLQRIENFDGILIVATNKLFDLDEAFTRRFQSFIEFPSPNAEERLRLWQNIFLKSGFELEDSSFEELAETREITGGMLINVLRYCALRALEQGDNVLRQDYILEGLKKEYRKERKMWVDQIPKPTPKRIIINSNTSSK